MKPLVSIVMPVYNGERYLKSTLDSVINQDYKNIELICVDDGSTDSSLEILNQYMSRDRRVRVIQQKNQFAGVARNNGMKEAQGKYIMFLDSDDLFERNMISYLVKKAESNNTDIIFFGFYHFSDNVKKRSLMGIPYASRTVCSPEDHKEDLFRIAQGVPWNKFFNREFVNGTGLQFQALQSNNDVFFSKTIVPEAKRLLFLNKRFVNYRISNSESLQGSYKLRSGNFAKCITAMYHALVERGYYATYRTTFVKYVMDSFLIILDRVHDKDSFDAICRIMQEAFEEMEIDADEPIVNDSNAAKVFCCIIGGDFGEALFALNDYRALNFVSKNAIEYKIGKKLLQIGRIKHYS